MNNFVAEKFAKEDYDDLILSSVELQQKTSCMSNNCFGCINDSGDDADCCCDSR